MNILYFNSISYDNLYIIYLGLLIDYFSINHSEFTEPIRKAWANEALSTGELSKIEKGAQEALLYLEEGISSALQSDISQLEDKLKNIMFCSAYATALCNYAQVALFLGKGESASEKLASAVKALEIARPAAVGSDELYGI